MYLGVEISSDLRWDSHVVEVSSRANRTLGFVRGNLCICSRKAKASAYIALVRPLLEYASRSSPIWDPYTVSCINTIEKVQRCAARWAMQDYKPTASGTATLKELDRAIAAVKKEEGQTQHDPTNSNTVS